MKGLYIVIVFLFSFYTLLAQSTDTLLSQDYKKHKFSIDGTYLSGQVTYGRRVSDFTWINFGYAYGSTYYVADLNQLHGNHHITLFYQTDPLLFVTGEAGASFSLFRYYDGIHVNPQQAFPLAAYLGIFFKYKYFSIGTKGYWSITKFEGRHQFFWQPLTLRVALPF